MSKTPPPDLAAAVKTSWHRFLETFEVPRPELYRYCRYLTHSPWDAEDLVQDTLARAFVTLGQTGAAPNPRAWLFRVASNLWIDEGRRRRELPVGAPVAEVGTTAPAPRATREAAGTLLVRLSPQENYFYNAEFLVDLAGELGLPVRINGGRWWTKEAS